MTDIIQGTVILGNADSPVMLGSNEVIVEEQGKLSGFGGVAGNLSNSGIVDLTTYMPGNILTVGGITLAEMDLFSSRQKQVVTIRKQIVW